MSFAFDRLASACCRQVVRRAAGLVLVAAIAGGPAALAGEVVVLPHRAAYDLRLAPGGARDFADVAGELAFEWADSCDGWSVTQRSRMIFEYRTGQVLELGWSLTSWEAKDGRSYRFQLRNYENGEVVEEFRGEAALDETGAGFADYSKPERLQLELPAGTMLPTVHSLALIAAARAGNDSMWAMLFDGTSEQNVYEVNALILPRSADLPPPDSIDPALLEGLAAWRVDLAFYDHGSQESEPTHEQTVWLWENGIVDRMTLDYGDFEILGTLNRFELLPEPVC
jgi:hypothetical protein